MWHVTKPRHRLRDSDEIQPWGLALISALSLVIGAATVVVLARS